jgi:hypothetical protein
MPLAEFQNPLAWLGSHPWAYPALEAAHIVGIALLLGSLVLFDLRVWGFGMALPVQPLARLSLSLSLAGFGLAAAAGLLMFASQPLELIANRAFVIKIGLLACAGLNAAWFHGRGGVARLDATARVLTLVSLGLWLGVIICGRWIAYI